MIYVTFTFRGRKGQLCSRKELYKRRKPIKLAKSISAGNLESALRTPAISKMVAAKYLIVALFACVLMVFTNFETTEAAPFGGFGGHHGGYGDIGHILAAGLVLSLLQNNG